MDGWVDAPQSGRSGPAGGNTSQRCKPGYAFADRCETAVPATIVRTRVTTRPITMAQGQSRGVPIAAVLRPDWPDAACQRPNRASVHRLQGRLYNELIPDFFPARVIKQRPCTP